MEKLISIVNLFAVSGKVLSVLPLGEGLINTTYQVLTEGSGKPSYVLQKINHHIFTDVDLLQKNIQAVTGHIRRKLQASGEKDIDRKVLHFLPLKDEEKTYFYDRETDTYWRIMDFIDARTYQLVDPHYSEICGEAFGHFQSMLSDISEPLGETIPDFHNMEFRLEQFKEAIAKDASGRMAEVKDLVDALLRRSEKMCQAERLFREGKLPKRICHCDTKVNNMLFDDQGNVLCVIDLDTVMPSFIFSDYGDFLRTAANTLREDDPDYDGIAFRKDIFEAFTRGYLRGADFLTPLEKEMLPYAVELFPYMQCVRFLTDYIGGDTYYRITHEKHNLERSLNQMKLLECIEECEPYMKAFIESL